MGHAVLLTGPERRRRWSFQDRAQILAEAFAPGAVVYAVARRFGVSTGLIYSWRRQVLAQGATPRLSRPSSLAFSTNGDAAEPGYVCRLPEWGEGDDWRRCAIRAGGGGHASTQMIPISSGVRVWIASGHCDMRKGGLALLVQEGLGRDPFLCIGRDYVAEPP